MSTNDAPLLQDSAAEPESATQRTYITETQPSDVLLGRGSHLVKYEGNIEFRRLIQERKREYVQAVRHSHKDQIARDVISIVTSRNGRFLRKVEDPIEISKFNISTKLVSIWVQVDTDIIIEKIKQAFRDTCKDGTPPEQLLCQPLVADIQDMVPSDSSKASKRKGRTGRKKGDLDESDLHATSSQQIEQPNDPCTQTPPSILAGHSTSEVQFSRSLHQQRYEDSLIAKQLLQYQQNQRLLLERLASQQVKPSALSEIHSARSTHFGSPLSRYTENIFYQDVVKQTVHQNLEAKTLQLKIQSELSRQALSLAGHQVLSNPTSSAIPNQAQHLHNATGRITSLPMVGHVPNDIIPSLQTNQLGQAYQSRQGLSMLVDSREALFALQHNSSILPSLSTYSALLRVPVLSNDHRYGIGLSGLMSGSAHLNNLSQETHSGNALSSLIPPDIQHTLNSNTSSTADILNDSLIGSRTFSDVVKTEGDTTVKRSIDTNSHDDADDESAARKKIRIWE